MVYGETKKLTEGRTSSIQKTELLLHSSQLELFLSFTKGALDLVGNNY